MECSWKSNWEETKRHFLRWWNREGLVVGRWDGPPARIPHESVPDPGQPATPMEKYTDPVTRARRNHYSLSCMSFAGDVLPISNTAIGPGSLALFLGSEPGFSDRTVWYHPCFQSVADPETIPPLKFDPSNKWWKLSEATARECQKLARGKYVVGLPDLIENVDTLASLRDSQTLLMDMIERPDWVKRKVAEINQVWFEAFDRLYEICRLQDGSSVFWAYYLWGPGKVAKVQCDASSMFSPDMFKEIVVPSLTEQCDWLDHSIYHLDGTQCIGHLEHLLAIESLDAIEWTPQAGIESGGSPRWYDLYRRILRAGKSVQAVDVLPREVIPLLDAIGTKGVYVMIDCQTEDELEDGVKRARAHR